jgi:hypothetical protein
VGGPFAIAISAVAVLMTARLSAQTQPATRAPAAQATATQDAGVLQGRVISASSGEPVRKAQVTLRPEVAGRLPGGPTMVTVGDDGVFVLTSINPGQYELNAQRTGFVQQGYGAPPASFRGTPIDVAPGQTIDDLVIRMVPQGAIFGRISDDDGDPIQGAEVTLWRYEYPDGDRQLVRQPFGTPGSNDLGEYRFFGLPPGSYIVSATSRLSNSGGGKQPPEVDSIATYYPRSRDPKGAAAIEVAAGSEMRGIDIRILNSRLFQIRGTIVGVPARTPAEPPARGGRGGRGGVRPQITVNLSSADSAALPRSGTVNADGSFVVTQVSPGSYILAARAVDELAQPMMAGATIEVTGRDVEGVSLRFLPSIKLSGSFAIDPPDAPAPRFSAMRLMLRSVVRGAGGANAQVQDDGTFQIQAQLPSDTYRLELSGIPDGYYLKKVNLSGQEVPDAIFDFSSGGPADGRVELVLAPTSGVLAGSVNNSKGAPAIGMKVTVVPASGSPRRDLYQSQDTDVNGNFAFKNLPPGKYRVYAWEQVESNAWMNAEFRKPFETSAGTVDLTDTGTASVVLNLIETAR